MSEEISETDSDLILLDELSDFKNHALKLASESRRELLLLSDTLDSNVYDSEEIAQAVIDFARNNRNARMKILVKDIRPIVERGHYLLRLSRRLSSKVEIRKLKFEPKNNARAFLMGDRKNLLYKHEDNVYTGFVNYNAKVECLNLLEEFNWLWDCHSEVDPSLREILL